MNASNYAYDTKETSANVINRIYHLLNINGWSVKTLSDESNIPYETLKNLLNRKIEGTSMHNIVKIAIAFQCKTDYLMGLDHLVEQEEPVSNICENAMTYLKNLDRSMHYCTHYTQKHFVPVYSPDSIVLKDKIISAHCIDMMDISSFPIALQNTFYCGIKLDSHCYHPTFSKDDVILIAQDRMPLSGETAVFIHHGYLYIRKFLSFTDKIILKPVNKKIEGYIHFAGLMLLLLLMALVFCKDIAGWFVR